MVEFSSYSGPMDRRYGRSTISDTSTNDAGIGVGDIGQAVPLGIAAGSVRDIGTKIKAGANAMEIQFPGAVRGSRQAQTPEMYGKDQRTALRELAEVTEVNLTTHASFGIMGLAGADQQGNFSKEHKKMAIDEIKKAIDFAADTAKGGSVVVHTGEFQRPISESSWARNPEGAYVFKGYPGEEKEAVFKIVDERTGHIAAPVRKNQMVARPEWRRAGDAGYVNATKDYEKEGFSYKRGEKVYVDKGQYVDYEGNPISRIDRVPEYDTNTGRFKVKTYGWDDFVSEAEEINKEEAKRKGRQLTDDERYTPEEAYIKATLETNAAQARGWALYYGEKFEDQRDRIGRLRKALVFYENLEKNVPEDERWKFMREEREQMSSVADILPRNRKMTSELIKEEVREAERAIEQAKEASSSQEAQARDSEETINHVRSIEKFALKESFDSYAEAGVYAYQKTKEMGLGEKPLVITMENIFPESYGSHPDELINLVEKSRNVMTQKLKEQGVAEQEARKAAEEHIKITLDTGHLNVWRKYWQDDSNKSRAENDDGFKKWMLDKTEEFAKRNMIGNMHLTDNYGYQDDHLSPGEGTTPVKEMVEIARKYGYRGPLSVEPGADATTDLGDFWGLMKTWKLFGSPVYSAHAPIRSDVPKRNWSNIQYSYFGQDKAPYFIFGAYAPSQDWTLWTQVPLE